MKKHLIIAAMAIVVIGVGLKSANAEIFYPEGSDQGITCEGGSISCAEQFTGNAYTEPSSGTQNSETLVSQRELNDFQFTD